MSTRAPPSPASAGVSCPAQHAFLTWSDMLQTSFVLSHTTTSLLFKVLSAPPHEFPHWLIWAVRAGPVCFGLLLLGADISCVRLPAARVSPWLA